VGIVIEIISIAYKSPHC